MAPASARLTPPGHGIAQSSDVGAQVIGREVMIRDAERIDDEIVGLALGGLINGGTVVGITRKGEISALPERKAEP